MKNCVTNFYTGNVFSHTIAVLVNITNIQNQSNTYVLKGCNILGTSCAFFVIFNRAAATEPKQTEAQPPVETKTDSSTENIRPPAVSDSSLSYGSSIFKIMPPKPTPRLIVSAEKVIRCTISSLLKI